MTTEVNRMEQLYASFNMQLGPELENLECVIPYKWKQMLFTYKL
jgi:hypothetical protein